MEKPVKVGSPSSTVNFYTRDKSYEVHSKLGDPNSEILAITTSKDLGSPSGSFTLEMVPRKDSKGLTWDQKLEVFDYVEIKMKGIDDPTEVVVMRGLIDDINKKEEYSSGVPQRSISVSGRDLGALLSDFSIYYYPQFNSTGGPGSVPPPAAAILRMLSWSENFKVTPNMEEVYNFFVTKWKEVIRITVGKAILTSPGGSITQASGVTTSVEGKVVRRDQQDTRALVDMIELKVKSLKPELRTILMQMVSYEGSFWNLFQDYSDKPFHEIFIWDAPSGVKLIVRPANLKDMKGNLQSDVAAAVKSMGKDAYPDDIIITDVDKIGVDTKVSDSQMHNFFFTFPEFAPLSKASYMAFGIIGHEDKPWTCVNPWVSIKASQNDSGPEPLAWVGRYGLRQYMASTKYFELDIGQLSQREQKDPGIHPPPAPATVPQSEPQQSESKQTPQYQQQNPPSPGEAKTYVPSQLSQWDKQVEKASQKYGVPKEQIYATMKIESNGNPKAENYNFPKGGGPATSKDVGLMQINDKAHPDYTGGTDPELNIDYGTKFLGQLNKANGGDPYKTAAAYNGGQARVTSAVTNYGTNWQAGLTLVPPNGAETGARVQNYVNKFGSAYQEIRTGRKIAKAGEKGASAQPPTIPTVPGAESEYVKEIKAKFLTFSEDLNKILVTWYLHNHLLKEGSIQIRGTNKAIIGTYVNDRGDDMEYYIENVSHNFRLFQTFTTNLRVTRGQPPKESGGLLKQNVKGPFYFESVSLEETRKVG